MGSAAGCATHWPESRSSRKGGIVRVRTPRVICRRRADARGAGRGRFARRRERCSWPRRPNPSTERPGRPCRWTLIRPLARANSVAIARAATARKRSATRRARSRRWPAKGSTTWCGSSRISPANSATTRRCIRSLPRLNCAIRRLGSISPHICTRPDGRGHADRRRNARRSGPGHLSRTMRLLPSRRCARR